LRLNSSPLLRNCDLKTLKSVLHFQSPPQNATSKNGGAVFLAIDHCNLGGAQSMGSAGVRVARGGGGGGVGEDEPAAKTAYKKQVIRSAVDLRRPSRHRLYADCGRARDRRLRVKPITLHRGLLFSPRAVSAQARKASNQQKRRSIYIWFQIEDSSAARKHRLVLLPTSDKTTPVNLGRSASSRTVRGPRHESIAGHVGCARCFTCMEVPSRDSACAPRRLSRLESRSASVRVPERRAS